ncbi:hypothetical protein T484DRAFT_1777040 [Baffinella frigidus]|nr:hypothetical protein T484DRAFT_1777040 [Cryptophyta sp. CCMP2293]
MYGSANPDLQLFASPVQIDSATGDLTFVLEPFHNGEVTLGIMLRDSGSAVTPAPAASPRQVNKFIG